MKEKKPLNFKLTELLQPVDGWKFIIFLPFSVIWQTIVILSVIVSYFIVTTNASFELSTTESRYIVYICDVIFLVDVFCSILHYLLRNTRKLRNYEHKPLLSLFADCLSLIPLEFMYSFIFYSKHERSENIWLLFFLNRAIRIYRVFLYFSRTRNICNINISFYVGFAELCVVGQVISHTLMCFHSFFWTEENKNFCRTNHIRCLMVHEMKIMFICIQNFMGDAGMYDSESKRFAICIILIVSNVYYRGFMLPILIFSCVTHFRSLFKYRNRYKSLQMFVDNAVENKELKKKMLNECHNVWLYGRGNIEPKLLQMLPMNMRKNIYSDMYWDAIRHSDFFQSLSFCCKRAIAKVITGDFYLPGTVLWDLAEEKHCMIYVASGMIQIMSEENSESPIISFSSGTVVGETNIFLSNENKAIVKVASFSEIHMLSFKDLLRVIRDYPADKAIVWSKLQIRIQIARMTQYRKNFISKRVHSIASDQYVFAEEAENDCVKWIKSQFRLIVALNETFSKNNEEQRTSNARQSIKKTFVELKSQIGHTSMYLPLLNISEGVLVSMDLTCLKTTIPWVIDPGCHFIKMWKLIIIFWATFSSLVYPVFIGWWTTLPSWLFNVSGVITLTYIIDILVQISTAVKTKDILLINSGAIFRYRIKSVSFYADIIAAIPMQIILTFQNVNERHILCSIGISLFKVYRIGVFLNEWCKTMKSLMSTRVMIKYIFFVNLTVYWSAALFNLLEVECVFDKCSLQTWYYPNPEGESSHLRSLAAVFFAIKFLNSVPSSHDYITQYPFAIHETLLIYVIVLIRMSWFGEYDAAYMTDMSNSIRYNRMIKTVYDFLIREGIMGRIKKRVMETLTFNWDYDRGDTLMERNRIQEDTPMHLKKELSRETLFRIIKSCKIFELEDDEFISDLCEKSTCVALPANSIVCTYGTQTMQIYVVHKGYLQLNSFLPKDTIQGYGSPILYTPGKILPIIVALNQIPSAITGRTLTDCELILFNVEDFLKTLIIHDCFKDYFEVIKDTDLNAFQNAKLALSKVGNAFRSEKQPYKLAFTKLKFFSWIIRLFLMRRAIHCESTNLIKWEFFRVISVAFVNLCWPLVLIMSLKRRLFLLFILLAFDCFWVIDIYIRLHVGFYNKKGIYISHTLITARHYLTSSFLMDLLMSVPFLHSIYIISIDPTYSINDTTVFVYGLIRLLSSYRILQFISYCERLLNIAVFLKSLRFVIIIVTIVNYASALKVYTETVWSVNPDGSFEFSLSPGSWIKEVDIKEAKDPFDLYLIILYCFTMLITRSYPVFHEFSYSVLIVIICFSSLGAVLDVIVHSLFTSRMAAANKNFAIYKYHVENLMNFLRGGESEDAISEMAIKHFDHVWQYKKGEDLKSIFSRFPYILHEDLMYPIYQKTLNGVPCFREANVAFFRILSRHFTEEHYVKGSKIIFKNGVNNKIYLIQSGQCLVRDAGVILYKGSMLGDIKGTGKMTSDIITISHVMTLTISSPDFFTILNNFYSTEKAFFDLVSSVDDYIRSIYVIRKNVSHPEMKDSTKKGERKFEQSKFEPTNHLADTVSEDTRKEMRKKVKRPFTIHPQSKYSKFMRIIVLVDAFFTSLFIPIIIGLRLTAVETHVIIYTLDAIWILKIIMSFYTAYNELHTGNIVWERKKIAANYMSQFNGFTVDIISVFPFELLNTLVAYWYEDKHRGLYKYCFAPRLLRIVTVWVNIQEQSQRMAQNDGIRVLTILFRHIFTLNLLVALYLLVATDEQIQIKDYQNHFTDEMRGALVWSYFTVLNLFYGAGFYISPPRTLLQITFYILSAVTSIMEINSLSADILCVLNILFHMKSEQQADTEFLKRYMTVRDVSPALKKTVLNYATGILNSYNGEVMPMFLQDSPYFMKVEIMQDLYMQHFLNCYPFADLSTDILKQLSARLHRHIYFPKDVITKRGNVDFTMYFIHKGEVIQIEDDKRYPGLVYESYLFQENDNFGIEQGLFYGVPHEHTFTAKTVADILSLNYMDWADIRSAFPTEINTIYTTKLSKHLSTVK